MSRSAASSSALSRRAGSCIAVSRRAASRSAASRRIPNRRAPDSSVAIHSVWIARHIARAAVVAFLGPGCLMTEIQNQGLHAMVA